MVDECADDEEDGPYDPEHSNVGNLGADVPSLVNVITSEHPLSMMSVMGTLSVGGVNFSSLEQATSYISLVQNGHKRLLGKILNEKCSTNPANIRMLMSTTPEPYFEYLQVRNMILYELMRFATDQWPEFKRFLLAGPAEYYVAGSNNPSATDMLYTCAAPALQIRKRLKFPGRNLYGQFLGDLRAELLSQRAPKEHIDVVKYVKRPLLRLDAPPDGFLLLSDSTLRQLDCMEGGYISAQGGATMRSVPDMLRKFKICDYTYLILVFGLNDAQRGNEAIWAEDLATIKEF